MSPGLYKVNTSQRRILVAISGIPGAGKSTITQLVVESLNAIYATSTGSGPNSRFAVTVPMDGFHYTSQHLLRMPQPEVAVHRRGAAFTYDSEGFLNFVEALHKSGTSETPTSIFAPSFDHAIKDPVVNVIDQN